MRWPDWYELVLLSLAVFRVYRLLAEDTILDRPRAWLLGLGLWHEGQPIPRSYRATLGEFITCGWCLGLWISFAAWGCWWLAEDVTVAISVPLAISAIVGLIADRPA